MTRPNTIIIIILFITLSNNLVLADECFILHGYMGNGCLATGDGIICHLPDGICIIPNNNQYINSSLPGELITVTLAGIPGLESMEMNVQYGDITRTVGKEVFIAPTTYVARRTPLYTSFQENERGVRLILLKGDVIKIYMHINEYYYVSYEDDYGFVKEMDVNPNFASYTTYRYYNELMQYSEFAFVPGIPDGTEKISCVLAIDIAKQFLLSEFPDEKLEHLEDLKITVQYNISHLYGPLGATWQITFSGPLDELYPRKVDTFDEYDMHVFYCVDISTENGDAYLSAFGDFG